MPKLRIPFLGAVLVATQMLTGAAAAVAQTPPPAAAGATDSQPSPQGRQLLDSVIRAMGGEVALRELATVRRTVSADWMDPGQQPRPWSGSYELGALPVGDRVPLEVIVNYATGEFSRREQRGALSGEPLILYDAGGPSGGFGTMTDRSGIPILRRYSATEFAPLATGELRRFPEALLLWATRSARLEQLADRTVGGARELALSFVDPAGRTLTLYIDPQTRLPHSVAWTRFHPSIGQTVSEIAFSDFRSSGRLTLPFRYVIRSGGQPSLAYQVRTVTQRGAEPLRFEPPQGTVAYQGGQGPPTLNSLGRGVYEVVGTYNSAFAVFPDYILMIDAPIDENYTRQIIELIRTIEPTKPIRLAATHFHYDHIGGIRYAISQGIPIWATSHTRTAIERMLDPSLSFGADALSSQPRPPIIETVGARTVFEGGEQRVELLDIGPTRHSEQNLVAYFSNVEALLAADVWDIHAPTVAVPTNDAALMFHRLRQSHVRVGRFIPVHGVPVAREDLLRGFQTRARQTGEDTEDAERVLSEDIGWQHGAEQ